MMGLKKTLGLTRSWRAVLKPHQVRSRYIARWGRHDLLHHGGAGGILVDGGLHKRLLIGGTAMMSSGNLPLRNLMHTLSVQ